MNKSSNKRMLLELKKDKKEESQLDSDVLKDGTQLKLARTTYLILLGLLLFLFFFHIFKLYNFRIDDFSYFVTILLFLLLLMPLVTYFKVFGLVEVRKDTRVMERKK